MKIHCYRISTVLAFSNVAENTVFFGDLLLRLPDITADILKRHKDWDLIIKWSVGFCNESNIFEKREMQLLSLVSVPLPFICECLGPGWGPMPTASHTGTWHMRSSVALAVSLTTTKPNNMAWNLKPLKSNRPQINQESKHKFNVRIWVGNNYHINLCCTEEVTKISMNLLFFLWPFVFKNQGRSLKILM